MFAMRLSMRKHLNRVWRAIAHQLNHHLYFHTNTHLLEQTNRRRKHISTERPSKQFRFYLKYFFLLRSPCMWSVQECMSARGGSKAFVKHFQFFLLLSFSDCMAACGYADDSHNPNARYYEKSSNDSNARRETSMDIENKRCQGIRQGMVYGKSGANYIIRLCGKNSLVFLSIHFQCQINTDPMKSQIAYLDVVGKWFCCCFFRSFLFEVVVDSFWFLFVCWCWALRCSHDSFMLNGNKGRKKIIVSSHISHVDDTFICKRFCFYVVPVEYRNNMWMEMCFVNSIMNWSICGNLNKFLSEQKRKTERRRKKNWIINENWCFARWFFLLPRFEHMANEKFKENFGFANVTCSSPLFVSFSLTWCTNQFLRTYWTIRRVLIWWSKRAAMLHWNAQQLVHRHQRSYGDEKMASQLNYPAAPKVS